MEHIGTSLSKPRPKPKRASERGELLQFFTDKINADRDGKRYKKLPIVAIAVKLSHLSVADLYYLKSICSDAERTGTAFGMIFFGSLKSR